MKRIALLVALCLVVAACGSDDDDSGDGGTRVGLAFDTGGRGDGTFNDAAGRGADRAETELNVTVVNGVVTFVGEIGTRNEARLLVELASRLDGVLHVESKLVWWLDDGDE